jgi:hypothetical protein
MLSSVAWKARQDLDVRSWEAEGRRISAISKGTPWWIGDWLLYRASTWGERYSDARRITGMDPKTLRNIRWVAASIGPSRRRERLSFSHHELVAGFEIDEQERWLTRAEADRLTVDDLRVELRAARRGSYSRDRGDSDAEEGGVAMVVCPKCGDEIPVPRDVREQLVAACSRQRG